MNVAQETNEKYHKWDKQPVETRHAELRKKNLKLNGNATNDACREELGQVTLIIKIIRLLSRVSNLIQEYHSLG